jgi:hypothetical protein
VAAGLVPPSGPPVAVGVTGPTSRLRGPRSAARATPSRRRRPSSASCWPAVRPPRRPPTPSEGAARDPRRRPRRADRRPPWHVHQLPRVAAGGGAADADEQPRPGRRRGPGEPRRLRRHGQGGPDVGRLPCHRGDAPAAGGRRDAARPVRAAPSACSGRTSSRRAC